MPDIAEASGVTPIARRTPKCVAVAGGKGGVGKSVVAASLSVALARRGHTVVLVDGDLGAGNQHTLFGIERPRLSVDDLFAKTAGSLEELAVATAHKRLTLICTRNDVLGGANPHHSQKQKLIRHLRKLDADYVVLDLGAGASFNTLDLFLAADESIIVSTPEPTALQNAYGFLKAAVGRRADREDGDVTAPLTVGVVINVSTQRDAVRSFEVLRSMSARFLGFEPAYLGAIPRDAAVPASVHAGAPVAGFSPSSAAAGAIEKIAEGVLGDAPTRRLTRPPPRIAVGCNDEVVARGKVFHVQTEDLGAQKSQYRTQIFSEGRVVLTKVLPYGALQRARGPLSHDEALRLQHQTVIRALQVGRILGGNTQTDATPD